MGTEQDASAAEASGFNEGGDKERAQFNERHLTFQQADAAFATAGVHWDVRQCRDSATVLVVSDQNPHAIKTVRYADDDESQILERRNFTGSAIRQFDQALTYLKALSANGLSGQIQPQANRQTDPAAKTATTATDAISSTDAIPQAAIREALANAIVHRDYAFSGPTIVNIYPDRIEIISLGGLVSTLQTNDLLNGISQPRNAELAAIFEQLGIVENYGSGIRTIMRTYADSSSSPQLRVSPSSVAVILPKLQTDRLNAVDSHHAEPTNAADSANHPGDHGNAPGSEGTAAKRYRFPVGYVKHVELPDGSSYDQITLTATLPAGAPQPTGIQRLPVATCAAPRSIRMDRSRLEPLILSFMIAKGVPLRRIEIEQPLHLTKAQATYTLRNLVDDGRVRRIGNARATRYIASTTAIDDAISGAR